jgi:hypothetical protein
MTDRRLLRLDGNTLTEVADLSALAPEQSLQSMVGAIHTLAVDVPGAGWP